MAVEDTAERWDVEKWIESLEDVNRILAEAVVPERERSTTGKPLAHVRQLFGNTVSREDACTKMKMLFTSSAGSFSPAAFRSTASASFTSCFTA